MNDTNLNCKKHRNYRAILKPRVNCEPCKNMYDDATKNRAAKGRT